MGSNCIFMSLLLNAFMTYTKATVCIEHLLCTKHCIRSDTLDSFHQLLLILADKGFHDMDAFCH